MPASGLWPAISLYCSLFANVFITRKKKPHGKEQLPRGGKGLASQPGESLLGVRLPSAAKGLVDGNDAAIQLDLHLGLGVFGT